MAKEVVSIDGRTTVCLLIAVTAVPMHMNVHWKNCALEFTLVLPR